MKKIAVLLLLVLALAGCGKKESGVFTVQNDSSHTVTFEIGQDYKVEKYSIESGVSKDIPWKQYVLFWPVSPKNIISWTQGNNKATIKNKTDFYIASINNLLECKIILQDNEKQIFVNKTEDSWVNEISVDAKKINEDIKLFRNINKSDIVLKQNTQIITEDGIDYTYQIKTSGNSFYLEKKWETENSSHVKTSHLQLQKINIEFETIPPKDDREKERYNILIFS